MNLLFYARRAIVCTVGLLFCTSAFATPVAVTLTNKASSDFDVAIIADHQLYGWWRIRARETPPNKPTLNNAVEVIYISTRKIVNESPIEGNPAKVKILMDDGKSIYGSPNFRKCVPEKSGVFPTVNTLLGQSSGTCTQGFKAIQFEIFEVSKGMPFTILLE